MPVTMVYTTKLLLIGKASAKRAPGSGDEPVESFTFRATKLTAILKGIPGCIHGGLNE